ncbi:TRAP transporter small permease subunit [Ancylobacter sp. Lp-2]|uniref:TRAP transporter small permease subunit n=1 Tax=Ancylobacter sp. Lp-2 TaxID=2881339 RepID=UPI001E311A41|nr:TRAP transporter small permease subunit [Ancylobacter sp. Lp-2]MCB4768210.1 TRAP transporter small permease subunit [Ancylobacter sp. Lp-2]
MQSVLLAVDRLNAFIGKAFAWCIVLLTLAISYEVFRRYVLRDPTTWAYDVSLMLYGALFMMAGAYTLSRNGHVRGDFLYRNWRPVTQAKSDLVLYFLFYFPGILALIYSGWGYFHLSYLLNEHSSFSPDGPVIWPFKALIPITGVLMLLQGVVEVARCIICIRTGDWPQRLHDVEEMEKVILEEAANRAEREGTTRGAL